MNSPKPPPLCSVPVKIAHFQRPARVLGKIDSMIPKIVGALNATTLMPTRSEPMKSTVSLRRVNPTNRSLLLEGHPSSASLRRWNGSPRSLLNSSAVLASRELQRPLASRCPTWMPGKGSLCPHLRSQLSHKFSLESLGPPPSGFQNAGVH